MARTVTCAECRNDFEYTRPGRAPVRCENCTGVKRDEILDLRAELARMEKRLEKSEARRVAAESEARPGRSVKGADKAMLARAVVAVAAAEGHVAVVDALHHLADVADGWAKGLAYCPERAATREAATTGQARSEILASVARNVMAVV